MDEDEDGDDEDEQCCDQIKCLQGLPAMGLDREAMRSILMEVTELAAYSSVVMGELPTMAMSEAEDLLGEAGLLGTLQPGAHLSR